MTRSAAAGRVPPPRSPALGPGRARRLEHQAAPLGRHLATPRSRRGRRSPGIGVPGGGQRRPAPPSSRSSPPRKTYGAARRTTGAVLRRPRPARRRGQRSHLASERVRWSLCRRRSTLSGIVCGRVAPRVRETSAQPEESSPMPIATPEVYAEMLDRPSRRVRVPGDQRLVVADAQRRAAGLRRRRQRRHHPGLHRRRRVPVRPDHQEHGHRLRRLRRVRRRGRQELPGQRRAAHRPLPEGQARRLRPPAAGHLQGAGRARRGAAVPVAHVGRLGRAAGREPADRRGAARPVRRGEGHPRDRGRRRRRRGGRRRRRDRRASSTPPPRTRWPPPRRSAWARRAAT